MKEGQKKRKGAEGRKEKNVGRVGNTQRKKRRKNNEEETRKKRVQRGRRERGSGGDVIMV